MLGSTKIMAFVPTADPHRARTFYEHTLGLRFISEDQFAVVFDADGVMLRVTMVPEFKPRSFTILGWQVDDIEGAISALLESGVAFEHYGFPGQSERGIWDSPSGARVAWFKDPDGNVLSLTQFTH